jgi:hypothetical protein
LANSRFRRREPRFTSWLEGGSKRSKSQACTWLEWLDRLDERSKLIHFRWRDCASLFNRANGAIARHQQKDPGAAYGALRVAGKQACMTVSFWPACRPAALLMADQWQRRGRPQDGRGGS